MNLKIYKRKNKKLEEFDKKEWTIADKKHYGDDFLWRSAKITLAAYDKNKLIGTLNLELEHDVVHIKQLIVSASQRKLGIGKTLLQKAESIALKSKAHRIYLFTGKNWDSVGFYKKMGYQKIADLEDFLTIRT